MRTTIDLPDELLKAAKVEAIERGITLRDLFSEALKKELQSPGPMVVRERRSHGGVFSSSAPGAFPITSEVIKQDELEDDLRRSGFVKNDPLA